MQEYARRATRSVCVWGVQTLRCRAQGRVHEVQQAAFTTAHQALTRHRHPASGALSKGCSRLLLLLQCKGNLPACHALSWSSASS